MGVNSAGSAARRNVTRSRDITFGCFRSLIQAGYMTGGQHGRT
jgi:hypothetical protein